jgi:superfamily II DNA or RNA helicase
MSELLEQALEEVQGTFLQNGLPFHIQYLYTGEISEIPDYPGIFFCSVQKTAIAIHQFRKHPFDLIVIDEAHRAGDDTQQYEKVLTYLKPKSKSILGLTATPYRFGGNRESLTRFFGTADKLSFVYKRDFGELEGLGPLTDYKQLFSRVIDKSILTGFNMNSDDDDQIAILRRFKAAKYRRQVVEAIMNEQLGFSQAIVFAIDTKHANDIATEVNEQNGQAIAQAFHEGEIDLTAAVDPRFSGSLNDYYRARLVSDFRTGKFKILVGVLLLSEGIDFPKVDAIFLARPTFSTRLLVQMIGRGLRGPAVGGTETCKVYDFTNQKQMHLDWHEMLLNDGNEIAQDEAYLKEIESLKKLNSKII